MVFLILFSANNISSEFLSTTGTNFFTVKAFIIDLGHDH